MCSTYRKTTTLFSYIIIWQTLFCSKQFFNQTVLFVTKKTFFSFLPAFVNQLSTQFNFVSTFKLSLYWSKNISKSCTIVGTQQLHPFPWRMKKTESVFQQKWCTQKFRFFTILIDEKVWERNPFAFSLSLSLSCSVYLSVSIQLQFVENN